MDYSVYSVSREIFKQQREVRAVWFNYTCSTELSADIDTYYSYYVGYGYCLRLPNSGKNTINEIKHPLFTGPFADCQLTSN